MSAGISRSLPSDTERLAFATSRSNKVKWFGDFCSDPERLEGLSNKIRQHPAQHFPASLTSCSESSGPWKAPYITFNPHTYIFYSEFAEQTELGQGCPWWVSAGHCEGRPCDERGDRDSWPRVSGGCNHYINRLVSSFEMKSSALERLSAPPPPAKR